MESPSNKSHRPPAQTPPHRRILSGLTDPFVSKPTDPKPTVPPTMRLPKMAKHDLHLDLGSSVAGTTCESKVSQLHRRKKWQDEPQQHAAPRRPGEKDPEIDKARRDMLAKQIQELQLALAKFDAEAEERKKKTAKENEERLRQFNEKNKGRSVGSDIASKVKAKAESRRQPTETVKTYIKHGRQKFQPYNEDESDDKSSASTDHDLELPATPENPVTVQKSQFKAQQIPPHVRVTATTPRTEDKGTSSQTQLPPHLRFTTQERKEHNNLVPHFASEELGPGNFRDKLATLAEDKQSAKLDKVPTHKLVPPHPRVHRDITDPSKIVHVKETPPAPQRHPTKDDIEANKTSPTPRRRAAAARLASVSSEDVAEDSEEETGGEWVRPDTSAESPSPSDTRIPPVTTTNQPITRGPQITHNRSRAGSGAVTSFRETHVVPSLGVTITTSTYSLPEGHSRPWVRGTYRPIKISEPPPAFLLRTLVPVSYKDSALNAKERADAFNERLTDIEKMTGLCGRYPGDRDYSRRIHGRRLHQVGEKFGYHRRINAPREMRRRDSPASMWSGHTNDNRKYYKQQDLTQNVTQILIDPGEAPRPITPTTPVQEPYRAPTELPVLGSQMSFPTPRLDIITERRTLFLESIPPAITIAHILRALGNTGRIEELDFGENYQGTFASLKFANEETAALFAARNNLVVPISRSEVGTLPIVYAKAAELLRSEVVVIGKNESRVIHIGPCPCDYFVNAYLEYMEDDAQMKPALVDYICDMMENMCQTWPSHFLDVSLEARGNVLKAIVSFTSIKATLEVAETCKSLAAFQDVKVTFGRDPCQGSEECARLGIKSEEEKEKEQQILKEMKEREKIISDERKRMEAEYNQMKMLKVVYEEGEDWMQNDNTDLVRAYEEAVKEAAEAHR